MTGLSGGFGGHLANDEVSYMILDGAMITIASLALTVMLPGIDFVRVAWAEGDWHFRSRKGLWPRSMRERVKVSYLMVLSDWI